MWSLSRRKEACIRHKADSPVTSLPTAPRRGGPNWRICPVGWSGPPFVRRRIASHGRTLGHGAAARGGGGRFKVEGASDWRSGALLGPKDTRLRSRPSTSSECQARQPVTNQAILHQQWASKSGSGRKRQWMTMRSELRWHLTGAVYLTEAALQRIDEKTKTLFSDGWEQSEGCLFSKQILT